MNCAEFVEGGIYYLKYMKSDLNTHVENMLRMLSKQECLNWTVNLKSLHEIALLNF
jgi:hypothetical protein